ncbi:MAG: alpha/beta hydrolase [Hyphomonas sp.]|uniref:alpha/beta fold hydrolase n=1 Tax=Hyphomonas sp. TaxID=87 RepID=UPI0030022788
MILFVHGVPDTPFLWQPLIKALGLKPDQWIAPALPGFGCPVPDGFSCTKEAYADWLIAQMEAAGEPVNIVGHDWGALLTLRACSMRPDLVESWCVTNAVIDSQYSGHRMARMWATPLLGELVMRGMRDSARLSAALIEGGLPAAIAAHEAPLVDKTMRQSILKLYRSARGLRFSGDWEDDLANLPSKGQLYWGENDPFVNLSVAQRFAKNWKVPLHVEPDAGHWACAEHPGSFALVLKEFWATKRMM